VFPRLLVAVDSTAHDKQALAEAVDLARASKARLTVIAVVPPPPVTTGYVATAGAHEPAVDAWRTTLDAEVSAVPPDLPVTKLQARPARRIVDDAAGNATTSSSSDRARGDLRSLLLGSVSHDVLRSPRPGTCGALQCQLMEDLWLLIRWLHVLAMAFFVGGQMLLAVAVGPVERRAPDRERLRATARRFGYGTLVAIAVLLVTGAALASHADRWADGTLQLKLGLVALVGALVVWHLRRPTMHVLQAAIFVMSLVIVWLGLSLAH
jgi:nucleotide-binding universal stress UspA family protein/uncharacterized membrane protein